eukprot:6457414-Pyramimonas_sp.AAC.1
MCIRDSLKCGKAVGKDGVSLSMLKRITWVGLRHILRLFQDLYLQRYPAPRIWSELLVVLMPKAKYITKLSDTRALVLLSSLSNWCTSCLVEIAEGYLKRVPQYLHDYGFCKGIRTHEITAMLKHVTTHALEWGKDETLHLAALDVQTASDNVAVEQASRALDAIPGFPNDLALALLAPSILDTADFTFQDSTAT